MTPPTFLLGDLVTQGADPLPFVVLGSKSNGNVVLARLDFSGSPAFDLAAPADLGRWHPLVDREPPPGSLVRCASGEVWQRGLDGGAWRAAGGDSATWAYLATRCAPLIRVICAEVAGPPSGASRAEVALLEHALGGLRTVRDRRASKLQSCARNAFAATPGGEDDLAWAELARRGLARVRSEPEPGSPCRIWEATEAGFRVARLVWFKAVS